VKPKTVDSEIEQYRNFLLDWTELVAAGVAPGGLLEIVRDHLEAVICLAEEAPEARQAECQYLVERYEALMRRLMN
jgi:hypothetical protein